MRSTPKSVGVLGLLSLFWAGCAENAQRPWIIRENGGAGGVAGASGTGGTAGNGGSGGSEAGAAGAGAAGGFGGSGGTGGGAAGGVGGSAGTAAGGNGGAGGTSGGSAGAGAGGTGAGGTGGSLGTARYLDRCSLDNECSTGKCVDDVNGTKMCTIACTDHSDCASEHICGPDKLCRPDDTGALCSTANPSTCRLGLCIGLSTGPAHCTRECASAAQCPAGFACQPISGTKVCVDIERSAASCPTGLSFPGSGCTAYCDTAADCPGRLGHFEIPPYTCSVPQGSSVKVCIPPDDIMGSDPIGATCNSAGTVTCRSGACNEAALPTPMCTQACTQEGGCGPSLGCTPEVDGSAVILLCARAGSKAIGQACASGRECDSGLCDGTGVCTRLCTDDALCPSNMTCQQVPGFSVALCRP